MDREKQIQELLSAALRNLSPKDQAERKRWLRAHSMKEASLARLANEGMRGYEEVPAGGRSSIPKYASTI